jgi:hypothetical protein
MSTSPPQRRRPLARRVQARSFRMINVPMRILLGLPLPTPAGRRLMLLYLTGRKTGRRYRQPISYIRDGNTLLTPGGGRWKLNLIDGHPVRIRLRGRDIEAIPEIISDPDEVQALLELMATRSRTVKRFVAVPQDPDGHFDRERLKTAIGQGFRIIRWHTDASATGNPEREPQRESTP